MATTASYTQKEHVFQLETPLGKDKLLLVGLDGREALSELFEFRLEAIAENTTKVKFEDLLGRAVTVTVALPDEKKRHLHGIVRRVGQSGRDEHFTSYALEVVPELWLLSKNVQSRIFQQKTVPEILKEVLGGLKVNFKLQGAFEPRNYCAQYRESDFGFASRLMEEEGIYYFFEHRAGEHTLVLANTPASHPAVPAKSTLIYDEGSGGNRPEDRIWRWAKSQELSAGKVTLWDHSFELPHKHLEVEQPVVDSVMAGKVSQKLKLDGNGKLEIYDYPGAYAQRFDGVAPGGGDRASDVQKIFQDNKRAVAIRMQEEASQSVLIHGTGTCRQLTSGHKFSLERHFDGDGEYVLVSVTHRARDDSYRSSRGAFTYENEFTCVPLQLPFRPARTTRRPRVEGCQTAVVVGPSGEEIFTDKYGRVKVQFHWDRQGKNDANSACWLRVASTWAGRNWGAVHIPRIGQEVLVDFLEGDPDRPIIIGSVYNADQMPPYALPDNKTQSGIKSRSTPKAGAANFNEIRFEDKKGEEQLYVHSEKNLDTVVENDETRRVGFEKKDKGDQTVEVFNNQKLVVGAGKIYADDGSQTTEVFNNQTISVGTNLSRGSQTVKIYKDQKTTLEIGDQNTVLKMGSQQTTLKMGDQSVTLEMGDKTVKLNLGKSTEEAMQGIELKVGQSSIKVDQTGVTIKGLMIKIEGQLMTEVKGLMTKVDGTAMLMAKGGITMIN
jgi:type VI secretion system secreted protein VgrG